MAGVPFFWDKVLYVWIFPAIYARFKQTAQNGCCPKQREVKIPCQQLLAMDFGGETRIINVQTKNNTLIFSLNPFCNSLIHICKNIMKSDQSKLNQTFVSHVCCLSYCVIHSYCFVKSFNRLVSMVPVIDTSPCRVKNEERETKFFIG